MGGWVGGLGWLEKSKIKLSQLSTKLKLKLKLSLATSHLGIEPEMANFSKQKRIAVLEPVLGSSGDRTGKGKFLKTKKNCSFRAKKGPNIAV